MKSTPNHWGTAMTGSERYAPRTLRINISAEIAESRAFAERLFRDYRGSGQRRALVRLHRIDRPKPRTGPDV